MDFKLFAVLLIAFVSVESAPPQFPPQYPPQHYDKLHLRFKVAARDLKSKDLLGSTDPYVKIYYVQNEGVDEVKIGRTETLSRTRNPDWSDIFSFDFDRNKHQRWHFVVKDHDLLMRDDNLGEAWVTVNDYVNAGEYLQVNLNKKGYLIIKRA